MRPERGPGENDTHRDHALIDVHAGHLSVFNAQPGDYAWLNLDMPARERVPCVYRGFADRVRKVDDAVRPLPQQLCLLDALSRGCDDPDHIVTVLPAITVRADHDAPPPLLAHPGDVRQFVAQASRNKKTPSADGTVRSVNLDSEHVHVRRRCLAVNEADTIPCDFVPPELKQPQRRKSVVAEDPMHVRSSRVSRAAVVNDDDASPRSTERESGAETGRPATDDNDIGLFLCTVHIRHGGAQAYSVASSSIWKNSSRGTSALSAVANSGFP